MTEPPACSTTKYAKIFFIAMFRTDATRDDTNMLKIGQDQRMFLDFLYIGSVPYIDIDDFSALWNGCELVGKLKDVILV
jgi:hypothetical protein